MMTQPKYSVRLVNLLALLLVGILIGAASYLQHVVGLQPCPLCISQRIIFYVLGALFLIGIFLPERDRVTRIHNAIVLIFALIGALLAARQIWLRHLPPGNIPPCTADFYYMIKYFPFKQTFMALVQGTAECTKDKWTMFGIDLPTWSLLWFVFFMGLAGLQMARKTQRDI